MRLKKRHGMSRFISDRKTGILLIYVLLFLAACIPYLQTARFDYLNLDDDLYVTNNPSVREGLGLKGLLWAFGTFHSYNWHPLTWISHMLDVSLFGMNPGYHHLVNVFFHGLNTLLLFLLLRTGTGALGRSAFVAALFALHPLHVESVAWISERKDLLSAFFGFGCISFYFQYARKGGKALYLLALFFCALSLLAKPTLVTLPFLLLLLDFWPLKRWGLPRAAPGGRGGKRKKTEPGRDDGPSPRRILFEKAPFLGLAVFSAVMTSLAQYFGGAVRTLEAVPFLVRIENALYSYVAYGWKMIWPVQLAVYYPHPMDLPDWPLMGPQILLLKAAAATLLLAGLSFLVFLIRKRRPCLVTGWVWYLLMFVPMIGLVQVGSHALADRYTYIPLVGLFIIAAWGVPDLLERRRGKAAFMILSGAAVLAALAVLTFQQVSYWKNSESLYRRAVEAVPGGALMAVNLGNTLLGQGRTDEAIHYYETALEIRPQYGAALYFLGNAWLGKRDFEKAAAYYRRALEIPEDREKGYYPIGLEKAVNASFQLGNEALRRGDLETGEKHFGFVMKYTTRYHGDIFHRLALAAEEQGYTAKAAEYRKKAEAFGWIPRDGTKGRIPFPAGDHPGSGDGPGG